MKKYFLGLIFLIILMLGGYFVFSKKTIVPAVNNQSGVLDTSNWKTYKNDKYGFEFRYSGLRVEESGLLVGGPSFDIVATTSEGALITNPRVVVNNEFQSPEDFRKAVEDVLPGEIISTKEISIDGVQATIFSSEKMTLAWGQLVAFTRGGNFYEIWNTSLSPADFQAFYSTFKFTK